MFRKKKLRGNLESRFSALCDVPGNSLKNGFISKTYWGSIPVNGPTSLRCGLSYQLYHHQFSYLCVVATLPDKNSWDTSTKRNFFLFVLPFSLSMLLTAV